MPSILASYLHTLEVDGTVETGLRNAVPGAARAGIRRQSHGALLGVGSACFMFREVGKRAG